MSIPRDIRDVVDRAKARGWIMQTRSVTPAPEPRAPVHHSIPMRMCRRCGRKFRRTHQCSALFSLMLLLSVFCLPLSAAEMTSTNVPITVLDARVYFIQPQTKSALVYTRPNGDAKWRLWQVIAPLPLDQAVGLSVTNWTKSLQVKVEFR